MNETEEQRVYIMFIAVSASQQFLISFIFFSASQNVAISFTNAVSFPNNIMTTVHCRVCLPTKSVLLFLPSNKIIFTFSAFQQYHFYFFAIKQYYCWATRWHSRLRHCATSRKVAGSIPDGVTGIFHWHNPSGRTMALGSNQPLTEMSTRNVSWEVNAVGA